MTERKYRPDQPQIEIGPLDGREFEVLLDGDRESLESSYAKLLDRYHETYAVERGLAAGSRGLGHDDETRRMNASRNELHLQLARLGQRLGKTKDAVQADVIAREGNLGEYLLPEFGLLTYDQLVEDEDGFGGNRLADMRDGKFVHANSSEITLAQRRRVREHRREFATASGDNPVRVRSFHASVQGMEGKREFVAGLSPGEVAVVFGNTFTVDVFQEPAEITPPGYPERVRRAVRAAEALRERGVNARAFMRTVGGYHDTVTVVGVAIPLEKIEPETVGLLRLERGSYGVRLSDMDATAVEKEYRSGLDRPKDVPIRASDLLGALMGEIDSAEGGEEVLALCRDENFYQWSIDEFIDRIRECVPKFKMSLIDRALRRERRERAEGAKAFHREFLDVHAKFFGKRH